LPPKRLPKLARVALTVSMDLRGLLGPRVTLDHQAPRATVEARVRQVQMVRRPRCVDHQVCLVPRETQATVGTKDVPVSLEKLGSRAQMERMASKDLLGPREAKESKEHRERAAHPVTLVQGEPRATKATPVPKAKMVAPVILAPLATRETWAPSANRDRPDRQVCRATLVLSVHKAAWVSSDPRVTTEIKATWERPARKAPKETVAQRGRQATKVAMVPLDLLASVAPAVTLVSVVPLVSWALVDPKA